MRPYLRHVFLQKKRSKGSVYSCAQIRRSERLGFQNVFVFVYDFVFVFEYDFVFASCIPALAM